MLDRYWFCDVNRISPEAPVPVALVQKTEDRPGGAANVAINLSALGVKVSLVAPVGEDEYAQSLKQALAPHSLIQPYFLTDPDLKTTVKLRVMGHHQQLLRVDMENTPSTSCIQHLEKQFDQLLQEHDLVVFSDYAKGTLSTVQNMIQKAKAAGKTVLVDPKGSDFSKYRQTDYLTPNRAELKAIVGSWDHNDTLAKKVHQLRKDNQIQYLLLTRSEEGVSLFSDNPPHHIPAHALEVFDVTGAGDTVLAALCVFVGLGASPEESVFWANRAGGIKVGKLGTAAVSMEELLA
jgi:rfaE bifunctional protein kinase chain/domain